MKVAACRAQRATKFRGYDLGAIRSGKLEGNNAQGYTECNTSGVNSREHRVNVSVVVTTTSPRALYKPMMLHFRVMIVTVKRLFYSATEGAID